MTTMQYKDLDTGKTIAIVKSVETKKMHYFWDEQKNAYVFFCTENFAFIIGCCSVWAATIVFTLGILHTLR